MSFIKLALLVPFLLSIALAQQDEMKQSCPMDVAFGALGQVSEMGSQAVKLLFQQCPPMVDVSNRVQELSTSFP